MRLRMRHRIDHHEGILKKQDSSHFEKSHVDSVISRPNLKLQVRGRMSQGGFDAKCTMLVKEKETLHRKLQSSLGVF